MRYPIADSVCLKRMATRKKSEPQDPAPEQQNPEQQNKAASGDDVLQKTAKAIGSALGKMAVKTGIAHSEAPKKPGKLVKKAKKRLPRKAKKLAKKKATS
jgi:hypothetical protein